MSAAIELFHRARQAGIRFREEADGRWIADCSPELWNQWKPAFDDLWAEIRASLRPPLARNAAPPKQGAIAWRHAGQAIERAKRLAVPSSPAGRGQLTGGHNHERP